MKKSIAVLAMLLLMSTASVFTLSSYSIQARTAAASPGDAAANSIDSGRTHSTDTGSIDHMVIILMQNKEFSEVINNSMAPFETMLAEQFALAGDYFAVSHPSLPNYFTMTGGSTFGVTSDCLPSACSQTATNIATLIDSHGLTWKEYAESMPTPCDLSPSGLYATKHNPFVYYTDITSNKSFCDSHVVALTHFFTDLSGGHLPNYSFITPNLCHDAHSCPLSTGDKFLSTFVPTIMKSSSFSSTAIFIVYDEGDTSLGFDSAHGGHVACILVSPFAKMHFKSTMLFSHYSLLHTVESIFGLGTLGRNDATATIMSDMFTIPV